MKLQYPVQQEVKQHHQQGQDPLSRGSAQNRAADRSSQQQQHSKDGKMMPFLSQAVTQAGFRQALAECHGRFPAFLQNHPDDHSGLDQTEQRTKLDTRQLSGARQANHTGGHIAQADNKSQRHEPVVQIQRCLVAKRQNPQCGCTRGQKKPQSKVGTLDEYQACQVSGQKDAL